MAVLSSSDASPSIVSCIRCRKYASWPVRYVLIRLKSMMSAGTLPWCEAPWIDFVVPLSGKVRFDWSKPVLKVMTRVMSVWNASTCRSNISCMCSSNESGMPDGASGIARSSPARDCAASTS